MNLTPEQAAAAMARGCRFVAADEQQVGLLSMQRRVFWIEGKPCLALRNDGFYETAATLGRLLEQPGPGPDPTAEAPLAAAAPEPVATPAGMPAAEQPPSGPEAAATPPAPASNAPEAAAISDGQASAPSGDEPGEAPAPPPAAAPAAPGLPAPARKAAPASLVLTANMVSRYVSAATVDSKDLPELIRSIHRSVCALHTRTDGG